MPTEIKCPNCGHLFEPTDSLREEIERSLRGKMVDWQKKKEEEFSRKETEWQRILQGRELELKEGFESEKLKMREAVEASLRKSIAGDYETRLGLLEQLNRDREEQLRVSRQKEIDFLKKEQELINQQEQLELTIQRRMQEERNRVSEEIRKLEEQKVAAREADYQLKLKELEKQLEDQKRLAEEMRRRAEQGSTQLQGEVQEVALEEMLRLAFPFDQVAEVGKGVRGADCIQTVRNNLGQDCGKIIYESKRTKDFNRQWIEKLKGDMRHTAADVAVLVSQALPDGHDAFGLIDGVWVCSFTEVGALANVLRDGIIKVFTAARSQENKGDKMTLLYAYLTSNEFSEQWQAMREGFMAMRSSIQKERDAMEKLWKAREKQLEKILLNAAHVKGSIEGIAGQDSIDFNLLEE